jgi:hypothetical protein
MTILFKKEKEQFIDVLGSLVLPCHLHGVQRQELQAVQSQNRASTASLRSIFSATFARVSASGMTRTFSSIRLAQKFVFEMQLL